MSKEHNISDCSSCYSEEILIKYINDHLSEDESARVEAHILECEMCSDVLDGLFMLENPEDILDIQAGLNKQIDLLAEPNRKVLGMNYNSFRVVAAAAVLLIITGSFLLINNLLDDNSLYSVREISELESVDDIEENNIEDIKDPSVSNEQIAVVTRQQKTLESKPIITKKNETTVNEYAVYEELDEVEGMFDIAFESDIEYANEVVDIVSADAEEEVAEKLVFDSYDGNPTSGFGQGSSGETSGNDQMVGGLQSQSESGKLETESIVTVKEIESKESKWSWKSSTRDRKSEYKKDASDKGVNRESNMPTAPRTSSNAVPIQELAFTQDIVVLDDELYVEESSYDLDYTTVNDVTGYDGTVVNAAVSNGRFADDLVDEPMGEPLEFVSVEVKPEFPGGDIEMLKFISDNYSINETTEYGVAGTIHVQFVVDRDGRVKDVELVKGVAPVLDAEALRVVSIMPNWSPGLQRGIPVQVKYIIPMHIDLK